MAISKYGASYLSALGRLEDAAEWLQRALVLDPLSPTVHADHAINSVYRGLDEEFEQKAAWLIENDPGVVKLDWFLVCSRAVRGNWTGAIHAAERALRLMPEDPVTLGVTAGMYAWSGNAAKAAELRSKLDFLAQIRYVPNTARAFAYDAPGEEDRFYAFMGSAVEEREPVVRMLRGMRRFVPVSSDARYEILLDKVGLSDQRVEQLTAIDLAG